MNYINVVPRLKLFRYFCMRDLIRGAQVSERLPRKHNSPTKRIIRPIPLIDPDLMRGIRPPHQYREIKPRRPPTDDVDLHTLFATKKHKMLIRQFVPSVNLFILFQELSGDDEFLDFGGAFVDAQRTDVAIQALDDGSAHQAGAAVDLDGAVDDASGGFGGE
jgi:hypothetical protein